TLLAAVNAPPDRGAAIAAQDPVAAKAFRGDTTRAGLKAFSDTFPPDLQLQILRGETIPRVSVSDLSPQSQAFVRMAFRQMRGLSADASVDPAWITVHVHAMTDQLAPILTIEIAGSGGWGYAGGRRLEEEF